MNRLMLRFPLFAAAMLLAALVVAPVAAVEITTPGEPPTGHVFAEEEDSEHGGDDNHGEPAHGPEIEFTAEPQGQGVDVNVKTLTWGTIAILIGALVLGILYLFKKQVGGFPDNPAWVAPITILRSADSPDEGHYGEAPAHGHDDHH